MAGPPLLIIYQNNTVKTAFLRQHMAGVAGWLWRLPQVAGGIKLAWQTFFSLISHRSSRTIMETLEALKRQLELLKPVLKKEFEVDTIGIFGSYSQNCQKSKSDLDILVTFLEPNDIDLIDFIALKQFLSRKLKVKVDLVQKDALKTRIKDRILQETIYV
jgi:uncharacterized protein